MQDKEHIQEGDNQQVKWSEPRYIDGTKVEMEIHKPSIWEESPTHRKIRITDMRDRHPGTGEELDLIN